MSLTLPYQLAGRYRLTARIGAGSFAETYLATDTTLGRQVAVKVLREQYASDARVAARFEREARAAASVSHPNIVDVYDTGRDGDILYIVMEWVDGTDLKDYIRRRGPLPVPEATRLIREILRGLGAIHRAGIIHRDVKSQNVLIAQSGTAKLTDFGVARGVLDTGLTDTGMALGTAAYMAPEQATGTTLTPAADIYAAGVILFEMLTGRLPFPGDNPVQVMYQHVNEPPPRPRSLRPDIPPALEMVVLRALAKDPRDRFQSAQEMEAALDRTPSPEEATRILAAAAPPPGAAAATRVMPHAGARVVQPPGPTSIPRRRAASAPEPGTTWPLVLLAGILILLGIGGIALLAMRDGNGSPAATPTPQLPVVASPEPTPTEQPTPTPTPAPPPTPTPAPTPTPVPSPTATPTEEPTPTPIPTPTEQPTPAPSPDEPVGTPAPEALARSLTVGARAVRIKGTDFDGALEPGESSNRLGNVPKDAVFLFGGQSRYHTATASFDAKESNRPVIVLQLTGSDDLVEPKAPLRITLNGRLVWDGANPLANGQSGAAYWIIQDRSVLQPGKNTLVIANASPTGDVPQAPWILLEQVTVYY
ncbi:MAG: protein kinase [Sphaerobacter sp.]|nr:protein kinase [Sphaerobacter sp.]